MLYPGSATEANSFVELMIMVGRGGPDQLSFREFTVAATDSFSTIANYINSEKPPRLRLVPYERVKKLEAEGGAMATPNLPLGMALGFPTPDEIYFQAVWN